MKADDEFIKFCLNNYRTPHFSRAEFEADLNKIVILKKMFRRYKSTGNINERLVLNNIIILINVFGVETANFILFYRLEREFHSYIKTFLMFLTSLVDCGIAHAVEVDDELEVIISTKV